MNKITTLKFIEKANNVHNNKYDYSKTVYFNINSRVIIICPIHGEFMQIAKDHLKGCGCKKCGTIKSHERRIIGKDEFIKKAKEKHGDKYDYSKVIYINNKTKVKITCPIHGDFEQTPYRHLNSFGCNQCTNKNNTHTKILSNESFIEKAKEKHGNKYDYSKVNYINSSNLIDIICPIHGCFKQKGKDHLKGCGCQKCGILSSIDKRKLTLEKFIKKAKEIHGNKYNYSKVNYVNALTDINIICPIHGIFKQTPNKHLLGQGCEKCSFIKRGSYQKSNTEEFIQKAKEVHGNKYNYSKVNYVNNRTKVIITCPIHGDFEQIPRDHLHNHGCQKCGNFISQSEDEIAEYIQEICTKENIERHNRTILNGEELDIYIPSKKIAIEYNGLRWHSEQFGKDKNYHLNKTLKCEEQGIRLIHIFEDEWLYKKDIVKNYLKSQLNKNKEGMNNKDIIIKEVSIETANDFINKNNLFYNDFDSNINIGCYYNNILCFLVSFKNDFCKNTYTQQTFAFKDDSLDIKNLYLKILEYFCKKYKPIQINIFLDYRWYSKNDNLFKQIGFELETIIPPIAHNFNKQKRLKNNKKGKFQIYDCGFLKFVLNNPLKNFD